MGGPKAAPPEGRHDDCQPGIGPGIPSATLRRLFGAELRRLRREQSKLLSDVAKDVVFSPSKLSRLEKGQSVPQERDVRDLLNYYGQSGTELGDRMHHWALERSRSPSILARGNRYRAYLAFGH